MNALQNSYKNFKMLAVPCNQFGWQEPGDNGTEILNCLRYVRPGGGFVPNFELTEKLQVNGPEEHPLFTYLKKYCPSPWETFAPTYRLNYKGLKGSDIRWNFEKFLIDSQGRPVMRYSEVYTPEDIETDIKQLLIMEERMDKNVDMDIESTDTLLPGNSK